MDRRKFLQYGITTLAAPVLLSGLPMRAFASPFFRRMVGMSEDNDKVLILIQLAGGNDGLNTVIPLDIYDLYNNARPNIAIPEDKVLRLNGLNSTGLNPGMTGLQNLYNGGRVAIVQGVSYPQPSFSHFRATDIWLTGEDSSQYLNTGWLGRYLDNRYPNYPENYPNDSMTDPFAIQIGSVISPALQGPSYPMGMAISNPDNFFNLTNNSQPAIANSLAADQIQYILEVSDKTDAYAQVIKNAAKKVTQQSDGYPEKGKNTLADQLKAVARLIAGGLRTKVYLVSLGGFDTHARQTEEKNTAAGKHADLLSKLSTAISVFMEDLEYLKISDKVTGMTFSEFGRRIKSNASGGTDHGLGQPMLVFGKNVQPGMLGTNPPIPKDINVNDNIPMQYDFRSVYATMLEKWFGVNHDDLSKVLLKDFPLLPLIKA